LYKKFWPPTAVMTELTKPLFLFHYEIVICQFGLNSQSWGWWGGQEAAPVCGRDRNLSVSSREQSNVRLVSPCLGAEVG